MPALIAALASRERVLPFLLALIAAPIAARLNGQLSVFLRPELIAALVAWERALPFLLILIAALCDAVMIFPLLPALIFSLVSFA